MDLSLETLSRDFSDGQLADTDSCIVRGPRSHAKTCAATQTRDVLCDYLSDDLFVSFSLSLSHYLSLSLFVCLSVSFVPHLLFLLSLYLILLFCCSEVEQSCDASLVRGGCIRDVSNKISLCISLVYVLLFLGVDASKCEHLHCRALRNTRRLNKKTAGGHA